MPFVVDLKAKIERLSPEAYADFLFFRSVGYTEEASYIVVSDDFNDDRQLSLQLANQCKSECGE
jgi:hypothetical protein